MLAERLLPLLQYGLCCLGAFHSRHLPQVVRAEINFRSLHSQRHLGPHVIASSRPHVHLLQLESIHRGLTPPQTNPLIRFHIGQHHGRVRQISIHRSDDQVLGKRGIGHLGRSGLDREGIATPPSFITRHRMRLRWRKYSRLSGHHAARNPCQCKDHVTGSQLKCADWLAHVSRGIFSRASVCKDNLHRNIFDPRA